MRRLDEHTIRQDLEKLRASIDMCRAWCRFVTVQDGGASIAIAQAAVTPDASHAVTIRTLIQPMCAPVPSLGRPQPAAWRLHTFGLMSPEEKAAASTPGTANIRFPFYAGNKVLWRGFLVDQGAQKFCASRGYATDES